MARQRQLSLTSPMMHGDDVRVLQARLIKAGFLNAAQSDGVFGEITAQAVHRAKYWLGYRVPDKVAGKYLLDLLGEVKQPTPAMKTRTRARKKAKPKIPLRAKALKNLEKHLGEKEHPFGSNRIPFASTWYGIIGPWCAMAVTRAYVDAGSKAFRRGRRYAYVPNIVLDARAGRNTLTLTQHPEPGDLVCFNWNHDRDADHVGLFERWIAGGEGVEFQSVEGNTSTSNDSNGGEVMRRTRKRSQVQAFVHCGG